MTIKDACKAAVSFVGAKDKSIVNAVETDRFFLFEIPGEGETYCSPIGVEKQSGKAAVFFPPNNQEEIKTAVKIKVPNEYKKDDAV